MKKKKILYTTLLLSASVISLVACNNEKNSENESGNNNKVKNEVKNETKNEVKNEHNDTNSLKLLNKNILLDYELANFLNDDGNNFIFTALTFNNREEIGNQNSFKDVDTGFQSYFTLIKLKSKINMDLDFIQNLDDKELNDNQLSYKKAMIDLKTKELAVIDFIVSKYNNNEQYFKLTDEEYESYKEKVQEIYKGYKDISNVQVAIYEENFEEKLNKTTQLTDDDILNIMNHNKDIGFVVSNLSEAFLINLLDKEIIEKQNKKIGLVTISNEEIKEMINIIDTSDNKQTESNLYASNNTYKELIDYKINTNKEISKAIDEEDFEKAYTLVNTKYIINKFVLYDLGFNGPVDITDKLNVEDKLNRLYKKYDNYYNNFYQ